MSIADLDVTVRQFEQIATWAKECPRNSFKPYPWQFEFFAGTKDHLQNWIIAGNQSGKSYPAAFLYAVHATGLYPDWWPGRKFARPPRILVCGVSTESLRDVMIPKILGVCNERNELMPGGFIHPSEVASFDMSRQTKGAIKDARIHHVSGGISTIKFRSYSQGSLIIAGQTLDVAGIDEEPEFRSAEFVSQATVRLLAGGDAQKGGIFIGTFTSENGATRLVSQLLDNRTEAQKVTTATWDDAPHLTQKMRDDMLLSIPEYQHAMRETGMPVFAGSMVYPLMESSITCDPFHIPDKFARIAGIDFGIAHPTAIAWLAYDRDVDCIYLYDVYTKSGEVPAIHAGAFRARGSWIPIVFPHDADSVEKGSGKTMREHYTEAGVDLTHPFANPDGTITVESGITELLTRMRESRFKVFSSCIQFFAEFRKYHRNDINGKPVALDNDILDAVRYGAIMCPRFAQTKAEVEVDIDTWEPIRDYD